MTRTKTTPITFRIPEDLLQKIIHHSHVESIQQKKNIGYTDLIRSTLQSSFADQPEELTGKEGK